MSSVCIDITNFHMLEKVASRLFGLWLTDSQPFLVGLEGELGLGKTAFVQCGLQSIGYKGSVSSPTYMIVNEYNLKESVVVHADFYRLSNTEDLDFLGWDMLLENASLVLVEWPKALLSPPEDVRVKFFFKGSQRLMAIYANDVTLSHLADLV